ncbi:Os12g0109450 [Oryza sativa Japonica Group]|uniref:Os12g0109450 protein n=1 Tax=Oryza sativa subsp. japonica TaxID=39947 RepID=A0A0N7KTG3_ORYSJ|nr:Os12g0109450 [Oryza sativa Japonica Group]
MQCNGKSKSKFSTSTRVGCALNLGSQICLCQSRTIRMQITGGRSSSKFDGKLICKADDGSPQIYTGIEEGSSNNGGGGALATPGMD